MPPRTLRAYRLIAAHYALVHGIAESESEAVALLDHLASKRLFGLDSTAIPLDLLGWIHTLTVQQLTKEYAHAA